MFQKVFEYAGPHKKASMLQQPSCWSVFCWVFSLCAGISGNCTAGHGGGNHCFLYHPACHTGLGMSGAASSFLWLGPESLS